jgi:hypothetical protein
MTGQGIRTIVSTRKYRSHASCEDEGDMMGWMQSWGRVLSPFGGRAVGGSVRALVVKARDGSIRTAINAARLRKEVDQAQAQAARQHQAAGALAAAAREVTDLSADVNAGTLRIADTAQRNLHTARESMDELTRLEARMRASRRRYTGFRTPSRNWSDTCTRSANSAPSSKTSPTRPTCWRSTLRSRRRAPARPGAGLPWWRPKCGACRRWSTPKPSRSQPPAVRCAG